MSRVDGVTRNDVITILIGVVPFVGSAIIADQFNLSVGLRAPLFALAAAMAYPATLIPLKGQIGAASEAIARSCTFILLVASALHWFEDQAAKTAEVPGWAVVGIDGFALLMMLGGLVLFFHLKAKELRPKDYVDENPKDAEHNEVE